VEEQELSRLIDIVLREKEDDMLVRDVMTNRVVIARPDASIRQVAQMMSEIDSGVIPIADDKVFGYRQRPRHRGTGGGRGYRSRRTCVQHYD
jgi:predicted transcriptional regulator